MWYRQVSKFILNDTAPLRSLIGGRVRAVMSGGAPLAPDTHDYLKTVLCCPIAQVTMLTFLSGKLFVNFLWISLLWSRWVPNFRDSLRYLSFGFKNL